MQEHLLRQAFTSLARPIEIRYPPASGIDKRTRTAAGNEYEKDVRELTALLEGGSDLGVAFGPIGKKELAVLSQRIKSECTPVLPEAGNEKPKDKTSGESTKKGGGTTAMRKSSLQLEGSPKKNNDQDAPCPKKQSGGKSAALVHTPATPAPGFEGIAEAIGRLPEMEAKLQKLLQELVARDRTALQAAEQQVG